MTHRVLLAASCLLVLPACAHDLNATAQTTTTPAASSVQTQNLQADVLGSAGNSVGSVNFKQGPHGVLVRVELGAGALTPGWHGLHLHQVGDCSDTGVYKLSGGHVGKVADGHGLLNPAGPEGGDTPNIHAAADGSAAMEFITARVTASDLSDADGSALIIHAGPDDHITQPIGGAGARVACAVIGG